METQIEHIHQALLKGVELEGFDQEEKALEHLHPAQNRRTSAVRGSSPSLNIS